MSAGHCHIIRNLTPPHLSKNEPSLPGLGDADVARSRRRRVISTVEPDEPASNFQQCDNGRGVFVGAALAGWFRLPRVRQGSRGGAEEPGLHLRMLELRSSDFDHGGGGDAPNQAAADDMVLGGTSHGDAFQWHVGAAVGGSARPHLQNRLAPDAEAAQIDGRSGSGAAEGVVEVDQTEIPFRGGDAFFARGNAGKILVIGAVEVIKGDINQSKPRRKHAKYLDPRSGRVRLAMIVDNTAASIEAFVRANVTRGATLLTDGHASYPGLTDYRHDPRVVGKMAGHVVLPWIHRVFALLKRWSLG